MKSKNLKALKGIESWLKKHLDLDESTTEAIQFLQDKIKSVAEASEAVQTELPPRPLELAEEPSALALFTDGGCRGNPGPGSFAYLIQNHEGEILAEGVDYESFTTNNKMELSGPIKGLTELLFLLPMKGLDPLLTKIKVMTDSKYVVEGMKSWVSGWKGRDWKKADGKAPENIELWKELDSLRDKFMQIEWVWIKGHNGHPQNEYCDRKANEVMDANLSN